MGYIPKALANPRGKVNDSNVCVPAISRLAWLVRYGYGEIRELPGNNHTG